jgi:hypothetical protein
VANPEHPASASLFLPSRCWVMWRLAHAIVDQMHPNSVLDAILADMDRLASTEEVAVLLSSKRIMNLCGQYERERKMSRISKSLNLFALLKGVRRRFTQKWIGNTHGGCSVRKTITWELVRSRSAQATAAGSSKAPKFPLFFVLQTNRNDTP